MECLLLYIKETISVYTYLGRMCKNLQFLKNVSKQATYFAHDMDTTNALLM